MAATRRMAEMVEGNRHLLYITDRQLINVRADIKEARRIARDEFERLDGIIRSGSLARANIDADALRALHAALHPDERRELMNPVAEPPPNVDQHPINHTSRGKIGIAFMVGVLSAAMIASVLA